jgi:hypothetical protein
MKQTTSRKDKDNMKNLATSNIIAEISKAHDDGQPSRVISLWGDFQGNNQADSPALIYVYEQVSSMLGAAIDSLPPTTPEEHRDEMNRFRERFGDEMAKLLESAINQGNGNN